MAEPVHQRRESRVELWNNLDKVTSAILHPELPGLSGLLISTSEKKTKSCLGENYSVNADEFVNNMEKLGMPVAGIRRLLDDHWNGVNMASVDKGAITEGGGEFVIKNGLTLRLRLPYADAVVQEVLLNDVALEYDAHSGYTSFVHNAWTNVDVHIPAGTQTDFALALVKYSHPQREYEIVDIDTP